MNDDRPTEDRLADALHARAGAARPSPDALDGVFGRVARHRRAVRVAAAASAALALVAGGIVASAVVREPDGRVAPGDVASGQPSFSPTASPTPTAVPDTDDRAVVSLKDGRVVEMSTTTGKVIREITRFRGGAPVGIAWSPDRRNVVVVLGCILMLLDRETGPKSDLGNGRTPAFSPDGKRIAYEHCDEDPRGVSVYGIGVENTAKAFPAPSPSPGGDFFESNASVTSLTWWDDDSLVVARHYEGGLDPRLLDVRTARTLADATRIGPNSADLVTGDASDLVGTAACCYPDWDKPTTVWRLGADREAETLFEHPRDITSVAVDRRGAVVFVDSQGLWRWDRTSAPVRIATDVVAVDA